MEKEIEITTYGALTMNIVALFALHKIELHDDFH